MSPILAADAMTVDVTYGYSETTAAASTREQFNGVVPIYSTWEVAPVTAILELERRLTDDWDGYGSPPIRRSATNLAITLIRQIARLGVDNLPAPFIAPVSAGGLVLEWSVGQRELSLSVYNDERDVSYLKSEAGEPFDEGVLSVTSVGRLKELITWLMSPRAIDP